MFDDVPLLLLVDEVDYVPFDDVASSSSISASLGGPSINVPSAGISVDEFETILVGGGGTTTATTGGGGGVGTAVTNTLKEFLEVMAPSLSSTAI